MARKHRRLSQTRLKPTRMKTLLGTIGSIACLAAALAFTALSAQAQNLLVDPGFESGVFGQPNPIPVPGGVGGGWAAFGSTISTTSARSGTHSVLVNDNSWNPQGLYQMLTASPGQMFDLSAWYMTPNPSAAGYATPVLAQISYFDSTGTGIPGAVFGNWLATGAANTWVQAPDVIGTAPAGTAYVGAYLMMMDNNAANGFQMYFDDVSLTVVPEPSSLALVGLGLMSTLIWRRRQ